MGAVARYPGVGCLLPSCEFTACVESKSDGAICTLALHLVFASGAPFCSLGRIRSHPLHDVVLKKRQCPLQGIYVDFRLCRITVGSIGELRRYDEFAQENE